MGKFASGRLANLSLCCLTLLAGASASRQPVHLQHARQPAQHAAGGSTPRRGGGPAAARGGPAAARGGASPAAHHRLGGGPAAGHHRLAAEHAVRVFVYPAPVAPFRRANAWRFEPLIADLKAMGSGSGLGLGR